MRKTTIATLLAGLLLCATAQPACAAGRDRSHKPARPEKAAAAAPSDLEAVAAGLAGFEQRAKHYRPEEWGFVLGYAHFVNSRWAEAERELAAVQQKLPQIADHILYFRAASANRLGRYAEALGLLDELEAQERDSVWSGESLLERGIALAGLQRFPEAQAALARALSAADDATRSRVQREIARTHLASGDAEQAAAYLRGLAMDCAGDQELAQLSDLFDALKSRYRIDLRAWLAEPYQQLRLAQNSIAGSQWADAAGILEGLLSGRHLDGAERTRARWMLARCYRWTHRYDEAIAIMEDLRRSGASAGFSDELLGTLATTYMKKNDYASALAIRRQMLDRMPPGSRGAAQMAYKIAFLHMDEGKYAEAIPLWEREAGMRGAGRNAVMARWFIGWCHYMQGHYAAAAAAFDALLASGARGADIDDRVAYWKARSLLHLKQNAEAQATLRRMLSEHPGGYYAELARRALAGDRRTVADFHLVRDTWPQASLPQPLAEAGGSSHLARAWFFDRLGLFDEASRELRAAWRNGGVAGEELLLLANRDFAHDIGFAIARGRYKNTLDDAPGRDSSSRLIWESGYPQAYVPVMHLLASREGVDPRLAWSIMQNESAFKPAVVSPVGAVGLMQLMPTTAGKIARERGGAGDPSREQLTHPAANISYGVAYLGKLERLFPNNAAAVIASYNAGEEAVARWLDNGSFTDIEQWIEEIPYDETNLYVKKVMTSYWKYQRLYGKAEAR